jgi:hypothetical protein
MHQTENKNDNYLGSGKNLKRAIKKYGKENFIREILFEFSSYDEMIQKEKELVTLELCKEENNYNLGPGGKGGLIWISNPMLGKSQSDKQKLLAKETRTRLNKDPKFIQENKERLKGRAATFKGKTHSEETKKQMSESSKGSVPWNKGISRTPEEKEKIRQGVLKRNMLT